ncbi:hypothetical protein BN7_2454 [Wickerhamomyces ciferrii]|uniref:Uncharacterized protein n=1 Tax=Wickerhamomyces ciferrii (strain ATCC 14091 / BCRC 22168 / CBS 111 / JCM 3599 / NBRC 0793 / NRRL Y-1031 F-60-10) TaxID=1206466 RepID=K0KP62_WICCF|nr:uncharacterized protein BN7_2454 [Wickerhamomyces ciferrii]CCH42908.1 hypothetical protein BN7_2454 [Wickerhamomyces ciferrii]
MSTLIRSKRQLEESLDSTNYVGIIFIDEENYPNSKKQNEKHEKKVIENGRGCDCYKIYIQKPGDIDVRGFITHHRDGEKVDNVFYAGFLDGELIHYVNTEDEEGFDNL